MQAITCELCGSNDLIKQDGVFVCQFCGTKYTMEEARKLLGNVRIEGVVETKTADYLIEAGVLKEYHGASTDAVIPEGVTTIGPSAFRNMPIESVYIPASCTSFSLNAFSGCWSLQRFSVDAGNSMYATDQQGCLWTKDYGTLIAIPAGVEKVQLKPASEVAFLPKNAVCGLYSDCISGKEKGDTISCALRVDDDGYLCATGETLMGLNGAICAPINKFGITTIMFPKGMTRIDQSFSSFPFLQTVFLPPTLELLDSLALSNCPSLYKVVPVDLKKVKAAPTAFEGTPITMVADAISARKEEAIQRVKSKRCNHCGGKLSVFATQKVGMLKRIPTEWKCDSCGERISNFYVESFINGTATVSMTQEIANLGDTIEITF